VRQAERSAAVTSQSRQGRFGKRRYGTAIRELEALINADPKQAEARALLGRAYEKANRQADAIVQYQAAVTLQSQDAEMSYHLGALLVGAGKPADAIAPLAPAGVKLNPGLASGFTQEISAAVKAGLTAGNNLVGAGQSQQAIEQYKAVLSLDPKNMSATTTWAQRSTSLGKLDEPSPSSRLRFNCAGGRRDSLSAGAAYIQQNKVKEAQSNFRLRSNSTRTWRQAYIRPGQRANAPE